jgi:hypothetical protein
LPPAQDEAVFRPLSAVFWAKHGLDLHLQPGTRISPTAPFQQPDRALARNLFPFFAMQADLRCRASP